MKVKSSKKERESKLPSPAYVFPAVVIVAYGVLFGFMPEQAFEALKSSGTVLLNILLPLALVFMVMLVLNLFVKPAQVASLLGRGVRLKGIVLSVAAGIISTGPIYAWYPLLRDLKEKGAGNLPIAVFLYNRAVKPFLLPVMIAYFGWLYVLVLTMVTVLGSVVLGYSVEFLVKEKQ